LNDISICVLLKSRISEEQIDNILLNNKNFDINNYQKIFLNFFSIDKNLLSHLEEKIKFSQIYNIKFIEFRHFYIYKKINYKEFTRYALDFSLVKGSDILNLISQDNHSKNIQINNEKNIPINHLNEKFYYEFDDLNTLINENDYKNKFRVLSYKLMREKNINKNLYSVNFHKIKLIKYNNNSYTIKVYYYFYSLKQILVHEEKKVSLYHFIMAIMILLYVKFSQNVFDRFNMNPGKIINQYVVLKYFSNILKVEKEKELSNYTIYVKVFYFLISIKVGFFFKDLKKN
jgi:hypothetical protein